MDEMGLSAYGSSPAPIRLLMPVTGHREIVQARNQSHCSWVRGTTESRPMTTSGELAKSGSALTSARDLGFFRRLPAFTFTMGILGLSALTLMTVPVPTAVRSSPV